MAVSPLHILLVEDAKENQIVVKAFLEKASHRIVLAENGKIGLEKLFREYSGTRENK